MTLKKTVNIPRQSLELLRDVLLFGQKSFPAEIWLVGGAVRDLALGKTTLYDLDLAIPENPVPFARKYANARKAGFVLLDEEHEIVRVDTTLDGVHHTIDISRFRAPTIEGDLRKRDFTINAMAVKLESPLEASEHEVFDPLGGWEALRDRAIVPCSDESFKDDPLRLMRAFRFCAVFRAALPESMLSLIRRDAPLLKRVSFERIRDEFFKMLAQPDAAKWLRLLTETGLMEILLPELLQTRGVEQNSWHHLDVYEHTLATLEALEDVLAKGLPLVGYDKFLQFVQSPISGTRTYFELFKFAALLHDLGKPRCKRTKTEDNRIIFYGHEMVGVEMAQAIAERFRLSTAELHFLERVVKNHMRPGVMVQEGVNDRRLFRYFSETGRDGVGIAILSLADRLSARGPQSTDDLAVFEKGIHAIVEDFYRQMEYVPKTPLLKGDDLIREFDMKPGPRFKELLAAVREAQHLGQIRNREEALAFVSDLLKRN